MLGCRCNAVPPDSIEEETLGASQKESKAVRAALVSLALSCIVAASNTHYGVDRSAAANSWWRAQVSAVTNNFADDDNTEVGEVETPEATEEVVYEEVQCDHVSWKDWLTNPAREWAEVRWVARRVYMTRAELTERFGKDMAKNVPITTTSTGTDTASDAQKQSSHPSVSMASLRGRGSALRQVR